MPPGSAPLLTTSTSMIGRFVDAQHPIVVEVRLLDPPVLEGDLAPQRCCDAEDDAALHLRNDGVWIDRHAGVDGAHDAVDVHLARF